MGVGETKHRGGNQRPVRPWLLVALGIAMLAGLAAAGCVLRQRKLPQESPGNPANAKLDASVGRQQRTQPITEVALAPLPSGVPLVERARPRQPRRRSGKLCSTPYKRSERAARGLSTVRSTSKTGTLRLPAASVVLAPSMQGTMRCTTT